MYAGYENLYCQNVNGKFEFIIKKKYGYAEFVKMEIKGTSINYFASRFSEFFIDDDPANLRDEALSE